MQWHNYLQMNAAIVVALCYHLIRLISSDRTRAPLDSVAFSRNAVRRRYGVMAAWIHSLLRQGHSQHAYALLLRSNDSLILLEGFLYFSILLVRVLRDVLPKKFLGFTEMLE